MKRTRSIEDQCAVHSGRWTVAGILNQTSHARLRKANRNGRMLAAKQGATNMSESRRPAIWRSILAVIAGYLVIAVCTNFGFKPLGGIVHVDAPLWVHVAATAVAIFSGLLGGVTAAAVAGKMPVRHAVAVLILL